MTAIENRLEKIEAMLEQLSGASESFLTLEEAASFLDISKSTLYKKTFSNEIPFYKPGRKKIYFRVADLKEWVKAGKVRSNSEIKEKVSNYLSTSLNNISTGKKMRGAR